jgi:hypothetical protein
MCGDKFADDGVAKCVYATQRQIVVNPSFLHHRRLPSSLPIALHISEMETETREKAKKTKFD